MIWKLINLFQLHIESTDLTISKLFSYGNLNVIAKRGKLEYFVLFIAFFCDLLEIITVYITRFLNTNTNWFINMYFLKCICLDYLQEIGKMFHGNFKDISKLVIDKVISL